ncbi:MAG: 3-oxoacyl-ACP reductase FabG [Deltaproteobacteria bacterium]|nr:3-oxoacyl-ACP reductase FabG [Deltaproteobacteria bacterium]MBI3076883.1 3-oxoacyl-ACP reductase FabG [Deltaproteobacteria bacterium]
MRSGPSGCAWQGAPCGPSRARSRAQPSSRGRPRRRGSPGPRGRSERVSLPAFDLHERIALVTGASRGIGRALALGLAEAGADIALTSRTRPDLEAAAEAIGRLGRKAWVVPADLSVPGGIDEMVGQALAAAGRIDILVNNAGVPGVGPAVDLAEEFWDRVLDTNLRAVFLCARAVARHMITRGGGGKIVNVGSTAGLVGEANLAAYCASKGGVVLLTKALAVEWARHNIQVNTLCPGYVRTAMSEAFLQTDQGREYIRRRIPMRRVAEPEELAGAVVFLASAASDYMTGALLVMDGGESAW